MSSSDDSSPATGMGAEPEQPSQSASDGLAFTIRKLLRGASRASLGTILVGEARPYVSLVTVATDTDGSPLLLLSRLADHTRNIDADPHVSLLFDGTDGYANPQQGPRVSLLGRIEFCNRDTSRHRFLARHPGAALYAGFADFAFYRVSLDRAHFVGGFGRAVWCDALACSDTLSRQFATDAAELMEVLNREHEATLTLLANKLLKRRGKGWSVVAVDPDGCDLAHGQTVLRLPFDSSLSTAAEVVGAMTHMAAQASENS